MVGVNQQILQILTLHINPPPFPFTQKQTYRAGVGRAGALGSSSRHSLIPPTQTCTTPSRTSALAEFLRDGIGHLQPAGVAPLPDLHRREGAGIGAHAGGGGGEEEEENGEERALGKIR